MEEVIGAAKTAYLHDFVMTLPDVSGSISRQHWQEVFDIHKNEY